ncbi:MAG: DUF1588 domain-containing protein [Myxococcota bacterium]
MVALCAALGPWVGCYEGVHRSPGNDTIPDDGEGDDGVDPEAGQGGVSALFLLTRRELGNTMEDLLGTEPLRPADVQPDQVVGGFASVGASVHSLSALGVEQWDSVALDAVDEIFEDAAARVDWVGCEPAAVDDACATEYFSSVGLRAWRRPLSDEELTRYVELAQETSAMFDDDPWEGLRYATYGLLSSPNFLYRLHRGEADPSRPGHRRLTAYELASKLSYALTQSTPDLSLLEAAQAGTIHDDSELELQAERLLGSSAATEALAGFCRENFSLTPLPLLSRDASVIDELPSTLLQDMQQESEQFCVQGIRSGDARSMFLAEQTALGPELASHYGMPAEGPGVQTVTLTELSDRVGIMTSAGLLTVMAHSDRTSPTLRGQFVRVRLLCQEIPSPPDDALVELEPISDEPSSLRDRLEQHRTDPACSGCHSLMDPIGFGLEHYDAVGRYRELDAGFAIDASGELDGTSFDGAAELSSAIVEHPDFGRCITRQWFQFAQSRAFRDTDAAALLELTEGLVGSGFDMEALMVDLVLSDSFRTLASEEG